MDRTRDEARFFAFDAAGPVTVPGAGSTLAKTQRVLAVALVAAPWLNPFAVGPSPAVQPWLVSAACAALLWLLATGPADAAYPRWLLLLAAVTGWAALSARQLTPEVLMLAGGLLLIVLAAGLARDERMSRALQAGLLLAAVVSVVFGLLQYFGLAAGLAPLVSPAALGESFGNLRQTNQFSTLCWIGVAVLLWAPLKLPWPARMTLVALLAVGSAATVSRTGIVQGIALTMLSLAWAGPQRRQRVLLCAVAAVAYGVASVALPLALELASGSVPERRLWARIVEGDPCSSRIVLWSNVLHLIALKPLAGWGWGNLDYAHFVTLYPGLRFCSILDNAHNLPLHLAVELGVPAALLVCGGALWWAWRAQPWREQAPLRQLAWALVLLLVVHSLLEYPLWYGPFQLALGASLGWLAPPRAAPAGAPPLRARRLVLPLLLLAGTAYAAWDYERVSQIYVVREERWPAWREDTLAHVRRSWLFSGQARFAELTMAQVRRDNAPQVRAVAEQMLRYSPEPRVIERWIESAVLLGRDDEAVLQLARYRAAFPLDYLAWRRANALPEIVER